jgi:hypothetical protein
MRDRTAVGFSVMSTPVEAHRALGGSEQSGEDLQGGGLSGAVQSEQADDLALADSKDTSFNAANSP